MEEEFNFDEEVRKFDEESAEIDKLAEEISSDLKVMEEAQKEADIVEQLEKQLKENNSESDCDKIKKEIAQRTDKIEKLLATIKSVDDDIKN